MNKKSQRNERTKTWQKIGIEEHEVNDGSTVSGMALLSFTLPSFMLLSTRMMALWMKAVWMMTTKAHRHFMPSFTLPSSALPSFTWTMETNRGTAVIHTAVLPAVACHLSLFKTSSHDVVEIHKIRSTNLNVGELCQRTKHILHFLQQLDNLVQWRV